MSLAVDGIAMALVKASKRGKASIEDTVRHLPHAALDAQVAYEGAPINPSRFTFAAAAMCLGFMGDALPQTFASERAAYRAGVEIRRRFDHEIRKEPTP